MARGSKAAARRAAREDKLRAAEKLGAFTRGQLQYITQRVQRFAEIQLNMLNEDADLTYDNVLEIFVPREHHELCRLGPKVLQECHPGEDLYARISGIEVYLIMEGMPYALPRTNGCFTVSYDTPAVAKVDTWLSERIAHGRRWGMVQAVAHGLNNMCTTLEQVRFFWPVLPTLLGVHEKFKTPNAIPSLPLDLKEACAATTETVLLATLLPNEKTTTSPVMLSTSGERLPPIHTSWGEYVSL